MYDSYEAFLEADQKPFHGKLYGTFGSPVQLELEEALAELEGAFACRLCHSGLDAIQTALMAFTRSGDHILVADNVYGPTRAFCNRVLHKYGVETEFVPPTVGADIEGSIRENTKLVYLESPGSNTFEIQDVPAVADVAKAKGIVTVLDNTWATPLYFKPFNHGVDVSIHSGSKYIAGHSDTLLGVINVNEERFAELNKFYESTEHFASVESCYRGLKGLRTLSVRLAAHERAALDLAEWLEAHARVKAMLHPALASHPEHAIWKRDFKGSNGVFAFVLDEKLSRDEISNFVDPMEVFAIGLSWGGFQSLIKVESIGDRVHPFRYDGETIIRLSVGLEDVEAMKQDLSAAIERVS